MTALSKLILEMGFWQWVGFLLVCGIGADCIVGIVKAIRGKPQKHGQAGEECRGR